MDQMEIKARIDQNNQMIEEMTQINVFVLNNMVADLLEENKYLQSKCKHKFENGFCIYCYKMQGEEE